jgi:pimeloyl-ACP methyl ester carboxylesterase
VAGNIYDADLTALLDAGGFRRPAMIANGLSGPAAIHYSVSHPDRVSALALFNSYAHYVQEDDYPWGLSSQEVEKRVAGLKETWGTAPNLELLAPSRVDDDRFRAWFTRSRRFRGGPD